MDADEEIAPAVESILDTARHRQGPTERLTIEARSFPEAVTAAETTNRVPVIAEIKPKSPTSTNSRDDDPVQLAQAMVEAGATALSVLTEPDHFGGSPQALQQIRETVDVPVLRKDFILREDQLDVVAADLVLLIARFVDDLPGLVKAATDRGFQPLVEVHTQTELAAAVEAGATIIGINNRDLARLEVDLSTFERVASEAPENLLLVAESGLSTPADIHRMRTAGADAVLIGTAIMEGDVATNTRRFTTP